MSTGRILDLDRPSVPIAHSRENLERLRAERRADNREYGLGMAAASGIALVAASRTRLRVPAPIVFLLRAWVVGGLFTYANNLD